MKGVLERKVLEWVCKGVLTVMSCWWTQFAKRGQPSAMYRAMTSAVRQEGDRHTCRVHCFCFNR